MKKIKTWLYEFWYGHPRLLSEEVKIICNTRAEETYKWMSDRQMKKLIKIRIREMYKKNFTKK